MHRRAFLLSAAASWACRRDRADESGDSSAPSSSDPCSADLVGAELIEELPFLDEEERDLETTYGTGLDGRRVLDLASLTAADLVLPQDRLFLRTAEPPGLGSGEGWQVRLTGRVENDVDLDIDAIRAQTRDLGVHHFECSGNTSFGGFGLQGAVRFGGVPLAWVLDQVVPDGDATAIRIRGVDDHPTPTGSSVPGASWVFRPEELADAFLATHIDEADLTRDHGWPVRLMVPGWYGCACIKWVDEIAWVGDDEPATSQMSEFASRTQQDGVPTLARDYAPAEIDVAAAPIRVEVWEVDGARRVRVVGVVWGGRTLPDGLRLWAGEVDAGLVEVCPERASPQTWGLWQAWLPDGVSGRTELILTVDDPQIRTRRLDAAYYLRTVQI